METPRCSLDAALPVAVVENLQKYRYILENIDGGLQRFQLIRAKLRYTKIISIEKSFGCFIVSKTCIFH
jgi:hypothetical protein